MTTSDMAVRARRTMLDKVASWRLWLRAFEARHHLLVDGLIAAAVTLIAIAAWYRALTLFGS